MMKEFRSLTLKRQIVICMEFIAGYISPFLGLLIFFGAKSKKSQHIYQYAPLIGGGLALAFYLVSVIK